MRPISRGPIPPSAPFNEYREALEPLTNKIGWYCSYCERRLEVSLAIEHVKPKSLNPMLELEWGNFLLGCTNCNSTKGDKEIQLGEYFWPDLDNTVLAFSYNLEGIVGVAPNLTDEQADIATRTLKLTGLDRYPGGEDEPTNTDRRWLFRQEAFNKALDVKADLQTFDSQLVRDLIIDLAIATGYWSTWYTVFLDDDDMRKRLIESFPGTDPNSFDSDALPVSRGAI